MEVFSSLGEAKVLLERWSRYYNTERPHSSLGYQTPREYQTTGAYAQPGALSPDPRSLSLSGPPDGQERQKERQSDLPCPSVRPPATALRSLSSVALSSGRATISLP